MGVAGMVQIKTGAVTHSRHFSKVWLITGDRLRGKSTCDHGSRDWSNAATSQGIPGATRNWKRQEPSPGDFSRSNALPTMISGFWPPE
ncbi:unnamed protein product [Nyctereutes procyonoides]|uniref:(raccoon dog) hypothetical protein n=1 Tax=Nyctereutes procyonoides TaxID=34880 RepID=A0A811Z167_NYCPR|nr:unnamed protein product [Nyctereutes procyonoides]